MEGESSTGVAKSCSTTPFHSWMEKWNRKPPVNEQIKLAKLFCDEANECKTDTSQSTAPINSEGDKQSFAPVSWQGISVEWFQDKFMKSIEMQKILAYGCEMWFVRNRCIPEILKRRGCVKGCVLDHIEKFEISSSSSQSISTPKIEVGAASCFISYTGEQTVEVFNELLSKECLRRKYLWIDLICVCQFSWTAQQDDEMKLFKKNFMYSLSEKIRSIGFTAVLICKWDDLMITLRKIWVLWELFSTVQGECKLEIIFSSGEESRFCDQLKVNSAGMPDVMARTDESLSSVDARKAWSFVPEDKNIIIDIMEKQDGIFRVNKVIISRLRVWFTTKLVEQYQIMKTRSQNEEGDVVACEQICRWFQSYKEEAFIEGVNIEEIMKFYIETATHVYGHESARTTEAELDLAHFYVAIMDQHEKGARLLEQVESKVIPGKLEELFDDAESPQKIINYKMLLQLIAAQQAALGYYVAAEFGYEQLIALHPLFLYTEEELIAEQGRLAVVLIGGGKVEEGEKMLEFCLEKSCELSGERSHISIHLAEELGNAKLKQYKLDEGESILRKCLRYSTEIFGEEEGKTLIKMVNLAQCLEASGKLEEADKLYLKAINMRERLYGEDHISTITAKNSYTLVLLKSGKKTEAEELAKECLQKIQQHYPGGHGHKIASAGNLSIILHANGKLKEAEECMRQVYESCCREKGESCLETIISLSNLGVFIIDQGKMDEGREILEKCYEQLSSTVDENHFQLRNVRNGLKQYFNISMP